MTKQYFVLGRNPELSRQEIHFYLKANSNNFNEIFFEENLLLIELENEININELGGTLKSGIIEIQGEQDLVESKIIGTEIVEKEKFSYSIFGNTEADILKEKFKLEKRKATLRHGRKKIRFQEKGKNSTIPKADYLFILHKHKNILYFGKINQEYSSKEIEFRDMNKPQRREHLAISPRLAKILINLSKAKQNDLLLDPFCGVGGILQEALLKKINVYGIDKDPKAIISAKQNLLWLKKNYKITNYYIIEKKDATKAPNKKFNAIATETPLGETLRKKPSDLHAKKIINDFENLIIPILNHLKTIKQKHAQIAITFPRIRNIKINYNKIIKNTGLKQIINPILETREKQYISREIVVFV